MTKGDYNATNRRTLDDLRRMSNIPTIRTDTYAEVHFRYEVIVAFLGDQNAERQLQISTLSLRPRRAPPGFG